jgi:hypothetical protein
MRPHFSDAHIRPALRQALRDALDPNDEAVLLEELGINRGRVRVDLAVVNGIIHAYEIKSDRDSLRRLVNQAILYGKCFDRVTIVVGNRHAHAVQSILPEWWGVILVETTDGEPTFNTVRAASANPAPDIRTLAELLWRDDAMELLKHHGSGRGLSGKPRSVIWDRVCELLPAEVISAAVRAKLKARQGRQDHRQPWSCDG